MSTLRRIQVVDSHTGGEPTRVVIAGGPDLGRGSMHERREIFRKHFDEFRSTVVHEPRGSSELVGALLLEPVDASCVAGVIFFNNVGVLGMCGHGTIGLAITLAHLGRIEPGRYRLETPVGVVALEFSGGNRATIENVPSYRHATNVTVELDDGQQVVGDVAWGGNWFFLTDAGDRPLDWAHADELTDFAWRIRTALHRQGICGAGGQEIDHIELFGPPVSPTANSRNFVLCPGKAFDRSPCGTGTSAKLACLVAAGKIRPGDVWRQESIVGSIFEGSVRLDGDQIIPRITGTAHITAESNLVVDSSDPLAAGLRP